MTEEKKEFPERSWEEACRELEVITNLMNVRVTQPKHVNQGTANKPKMVLSGTYEITPYATEDLQFMRIAAMNLLAKYIDRGELVQYETKEEVKKEEAPSEVRSGYVAVEHQEETNKVE